MIKIITDSTSDIDLEYAKELNIDIVPLKVIIDGKEYKDRVDLQPQQFYELLAQSSVLPTTSQPSPQDFLEYYEEAKKQGDSVIVMTLSSTISGTYQSANIAKDLAEYDDIYVIDSYSTTQSLRLLTLKAISLREEGKNAKEIFEILEDYKKRIRIIAFVDTLEYLYKGGRLSKTAATAGTLLKFKPIIGLKDGKLEMFAKARGTIKATSKIIELIHEDGEIDLNEPICIGYTGSDDGLDKFEQTMRNEFGFGEVLHGCVGPVIGTHAGPGARLIAYTKK
ncbi:MAG: DegV family protein [Coprobacillus cateniformis]|uniref:DegV family protein n=1 Tax=Longibaculum muris TaxID=1796628 RepID=UPI003AB88FD3|nr:DegV family protein [Coprobacillus cateniformis]